MNAFFALLAMTAVLCVLISWIPTYGQTDCPQPPIPPEGCLCGMMICGVSPGAEPVLILGDISPSEPVVGDYVFQLVIDGWDDDCVPAELPGYPGVFCMPECCRGPYLEGLFCPGKPSCNGIEFDPCYSSGPIETCSWQIPPGSPPQSYLSCPVQWQLTGPDVSTPATWRQLVGGIAMPFEPTWPGTYTITAVMCDTCPCQCPPGPGQSGGMGERVQIVTTVEVLAPDFGGDGDPNHCTGSLPIHLTAFNLPKQGGIPVQPSWTILGDNLGASIDQNGMLTSGDESGTIRVRAAWPSFVYQNQVLAVEKLIRVGGEGNGGGCSTGKCGASGGTGVANLRGVDFRISLGTDAFGNSFGDLRILGDAPAAAMATPAGVQYDVLPSPILGLEVTRSENGDIAEIKTPGLIASIQTSPTYHIDLHRRDSSGQTISPPFESWEITFASPDLYIKKKTGGLVRLEYKYQVISDVLLLHTSDGVSTIHRTEWEEWSPDGSLRTYRILDENGNESYRHQEQYTILPGGQRGKLKTLETLFTQAGAGNSLQTQRGYWPANASIVSAREQLRWVRRPDGSWSYYDYQEENSVDLHRLNVVVNSWNDVLPASGDFSSIGNVQAFADSAKATWYSYAPNGSDDDGAILARSPRCLTEKILGQVMGHTYFSYKLIPDLANPGQVNLRVIEKRAFRDVSYTDSSNLTTTTLYEGMNDNKPLEIVYPDTRKDTYAYDSCTLSFAGGGSAPITADVGPFKRTRVSHYGTGQALISYKSTQDVSVFDWAGRQVLWETHVWDGTNWNRVAWKVQTYDFFGHLLDTFQSNNTETHAIWECCSQTSYSDEAGSETTFSPPDVLGRVSDTTKIGSSSLCGLPSQPAIQTHHDFDGLGRVTHTRISGGDLIQDSYATYDWAGRLLTKTNEANLTTNYQYCTTPICGSPTDTSCRRSIVTSPTGATVITEHYLDGRVRCVTGTGVVARYYQYGVEVLTLNGLSVPTEWTRVSIGTETSVRYEKTWNDFLSRQVQQEKPGYWEDQTQLASVKTNWYYDFAGRLLHVAKSAFTPDSQNVSGGGNGGLGGCIDCPPSGGGSGTTSAGSWNNDGADVWYAYDQMGTLFQTGPSLDGLDGLQPEGSDRITETDTLFTNNEGAWWSETSTYAYPTIGNGSKILVGKQREQLTGLVAPMTRHSRSTDGKGWVTVSTTSINRHAKTVIETTDTPVSTTPAINVFINGYVQTTQTDAGLVYCNEYDALGRRVRVYDPRIGPTTTQFDPNTHRVVSVEDPAGKRISYGYDPQTGHLTSITNHDLKTTYYEYNLRNQLTRVWGDVPQPTETEYDSVYGQRIKLKTYRDSSIDWSSTTWPNPSDTQADVTIWAFDEATGLLTVKLYAESSNKITYRYKIGGALSDRIWARACVSCTTQDLRTTYEYDEQTGEISAVEYSDVNSAISKATPDLAFTYDRLGRRLQITQKDGQSGSTIMQHSFGYSGLELVTEHATGSFFGKLITRTTTNPPAPPEIPGDIIPPYDGIDHELYVGTASIPDQDYFATYHFNTLGRLDAVGGPGLNGGSVKYSYLTQSSQVEKTEFRDAGMDIAGQAIRGFEPQRNLIASVGNTWGTPVQLVSKYQYQNDNLGRQSSVVRTGTTFAAGNLDLFHYNYRNELADSTRFNSTDPGNPTDHDLYHSYSWDYDAIGNRTIALDTGTNVQWYETNKLNQYTTANNGTESFLYDLDGNLKQDRAYKYAWDAENRLTEVKPISTNPPQGSRRLTFAYDYMGRRVQKCLYAREGSTWNLMSDKRFVYDGWNLLIEIDGINGNSALRAYTWGLDVSGTLQGASGVGGLLAMHDTQGTSMVGDDRNYAYLYDANGNVAQIVDLADGSLYRSYAYDPYGGQITGPVPVSGTDSNPFRYSTKYCDDELLSTGAAEDFYYYGYRYYLPRLGRWVNRDPIEEGGGLNLYAFVGNSPPNAFDPDGRLIVGLTGWAGAGLFELTKLGKEIAEQINAVRGVENVHKYEWPEENPVVLNGTEAAQLDKLADLLRQYKNRRFPNGVRKKCYLEGVILYGFSDGAMTIFQLFEQGKAASALDLGDHHFAGISYVAFIDMVRHSTDFHFGTPAFNELVRKEGPWSHSSIGLRDEELIRFGQSYYQEADLPGFIDYGWKGFQNIGGLEAWRVQPAHHLDIVTASSMLERIKFTSVGKYLEHIAEQERN